MSSVASDELNEWQDVVVKTEDVNENEQKVKEEEKTIDSLEEHKEEEKTTDSLEEHKEEEKTADSLEEKSKEEEKQVEPLEWHNKEEPKEEKDVDILQDAFDSLLERFRNLELENMRLKELHETKNNELEALFHRFEQMRLNNTNKVSFADKNISTEYMNYGPVDYNLVENAFHAVKNIMGNKNFYIGATSSPDNRMKQHRRSGYSSMNLLYKTESYNDAERFEAALLNMVYHMSTCGNRRNGSYGLVKSKNVFYVYVMQ